MDYNEVFLEQLINHNLLSWANNKWCETDQCLKLLKIGETLAKAQLNGKECKFPARRAKYRCTVCTYATKDLDKLYDHYSRNWLSHNALDIIAEYEVKNGRNLISKENKWHHCLGCGRPYASRKKLLAHAA